MTHGYAETIVVLFRNNDTNKKASLFVPIVHGEVNQFFSFAITG
jgi:hypothetical protein